MQLRARKLYRTKILVTLEFSHFSRLDLSLDDLFDPDESDFLDDDFFVYFSLEHRRRP